MDIFVSLALSELGLGLVGVRELEGSEILGEAERELEVVILLSHARKLGFKWN